MRRLKGMGESVEDLKDVFLKQVRGVMELAGALTQTDVKDLERVQKTTLHIMLGGDYKDYRNALDIV